MTLGDDDKPMTKTTSKTVLKHARSTPSGGLPKVPPMAGGLREPAGLDDLLNYRLARLAAASGAPVIRLCEGGFGISRREWRLVGLLAAHGALSPSALAERAHLDRTRTSRAITGLVEKQLIARVAKEGDRRRAEVALNARGQALYDELFPQVAAINQAILGVLDDTLLAAFDDALRRLTAHASQLNQELVTEVHADRSRGGSRMHWPLPAAPAAPAPKRRPSR
jgi:DNA-binding MarR family transcriptional regulator